tara:strand:+ start:147 stop:413 length:267 start_codon:yes stop_codon:yes gene_type:complete
MSDIFKPEKTIWKMKDGSFFEGSLAELPKSGASKIAQAGKEVSKKWLKEQGWKDSSAKKKAPAKKAPAKKAAPKKKVETKAVKPAEDK